MSKLFAFLVLGLTGGLAAQAPAQEGAAEQGVRLEVDLSERKLHVYHQGSLMNTFDVAVGMPEHPTPKGEFSIDRIIWNPGWVPPDEGWAKDETRKAPGDPENPMQGAKLFFQYPDYYIHGTNAPGSLGEAASHGCIRMREADVENLAEFVQKAGGADRGVDWFTAVRASETRTESVRLPDPVRFVIRG